MALKIEYMGVNELAGYERNARTHSKDQIEQIKASIDEFGFVNPVLIDENNVLIAGHGRTEAAKQMGLEKVPAIRLVGLTENQKKAYRIADNQLPLNAGWDLELLSIEIAELESNGFDLELMGFDDQFLDDLLDGSLLAGDDEPEEYADDTEPSEPPEIPVTEFGDIWKLGRHRLMCGDSTSIQNVKQLMGSAHADLLVTDPPYNVAYEGGTADALTIQNDDMDDASFRKFLRDAFAAADAAMKPGSAFYIWHADSEGFNFRAAAKDVGWTIRQCLIWNKNSMVMGRQDYHWKHEPCLYGWKDGGAHYWGSDRKQTTVLDFNKPLRNGEHPTMKPIDLIEYQVKNSSRRGGVVLDLFGGSGSTLIACENSGRTSYTMELDPKYCDVIIKRWQEHTGEDAIHIETDITFSEMEQGRNDGMTDHKNLEAANDPVFMQKQRA